MRIAISILFGLLISLSISAQDITFLHDKIIDVGEIAQGEPIKGAIEFVNNGQTPVEVEEVKPSCGCTVASLEQKVFAAGEKAHIPFTIDTEKFSGSIRKTIRIYFKGGAESKPSSEVVVVQAQIKTDLKISPKYLTMRNIAVNPDTVISKFFEIENTSDSAIEINRIYSSDKRLIVSPETAEIPAGKSHLVRLDFTPDQPGSLNPVIHIEAKNRKQRQLSLRVFIYVSGDTASANGK